MLLTTREPVKLIHKFFLAFFITNIILVGLMFVFIYSNFAAEFNHFVEQEEQKHVVEVKQQLVQLYAEVGSWEPISHSSQLWRSIVDPKMNPSGPKGIQQNNSDINLSANDEKSISEQQAPSLLWSSLPADLLQTGKRISLYDHDKNVVVGRENVIDNPHIEPVLLNNNVIGWIGLVPTSLVENSSANVFLAAQFHNYFTITLCVILLAFMMAIVLSRHLTKPIKQLVFATNELNKGHYDSRISSLTQDELGTLSHNVADPKRITLLINQVDNLNHIVDDLAQLANSDSANMKYQYDEVDVIQVLQQTIENYTARFQEHKLRVNSDALKNAQPCTVNGDKDRLQQLFANLLENTCRYTHEGGQVNIKINKMNYKLELILEDSAPGVLPQDQAKLFERFYRVEKSRNRDYGGSGLGLSLCKKIVEAHGGEI